MDAGMLRAVLYWQLHMVGKQVLHRRTEMLCQASSSKAIKEFLVLHDRVSICSCVTILAIKEIDSKRFTNHTILCFWKLLVRFQHNTLHYSQKEYIVRSSHQSVREKKLFLTRLCSCSCSLSSFPPLFFPLSLLLSLLSVTCLNAEGNPNLKYSRGECFLKYLHRQVHTSLLKLKAIF